MENYNAWPKEKLIEHLTAYGSALHDLGGLALKQQFEIKKLRERVTWIEEIRGLMHGA